MRKLKLDPESLCVESFEAISGATGMGTVNGHIRQEPAEPATIEPCQPYTATCGASCYGSCVATCQASCYGTCYDYTCSGASCGYSCNPLARCVPPADPA